MSIKTIVELDLVGYSDLGRALEENLGVRVVAEVNTQIQVFVDRGLDAIRAKRENVVFATTGDGAILGFDSAVDAHHFAVALHAAAQEHNAVRTMQIAHRWFRVGIATGDLHQEPRDQGGQQIAGKVIVEAVRLETAARPGQILIDRPTFAALPHDLGRLYGQEEVVAGKRSERFFVRRCTVSVYTSMSESEWLPKVDDHSLVGSIDSLKLDHFVKQIAGRPGVTLAAFCATWSEPCRTMLSTLNEIALSYGSAIRVVSIEVSPNDSTILKLDIHLLPTVLIYIDGELRERVIGRQPSGLLREIVQRYVPSQQ